MAEVAPRPGADPRAACDAGIAGAPHRLCRPEIGLWALAVPGSETAESRDEAAAVLGDLAALPDGLSRAEVARAVRRRIEREALRSGHRQQSRRRPEGVSILAAIVSPPHTMCVRTGVGRLYRLGPDGLTAIGFEGRSRSADNALQPEVTRIHLEAGDRLVLASCDLSADMMRPVDAALLREPPDTAARRLAAHAAEAGERLPAVLVLAARTVAKAASSQPVSPSRDRSPAGGRARPAGRAPLPLLLGVGALAVLTALAVGLALSHRPGPPPAEPPAPVPTADPDLAALGLSSADIGAADRRLAQTVRLAVAVNAIDRALDRLDLPPAAGSAPIADPFSPAALDAHARLLAARLPGLPLAPPLRIEYQKSSPFGVRVHPITGLTMMHTGVDLVAPAGTPIFATGAGRVLRSGPAGGYGNMVEVQHADGLVTRYAHMQSLAVGVGDPVAVGTVVGTLGSTGESTGPHLHYEVRRGDIPVDPMPFLEAGQALKAALLVAFRK
ncbi:M23 family metallopeptidase [Inquilinus sp. Marseille-Q2685]|uniref:M23 family metallopeptidase n=1 Tax=Inquilinus sp. Marseille-Q2685 TaxID=2866581 RepID=UPI001CE4ADE4|nr:M23 family metallopeptidase [Inquilinus sp. Marseille-Q2685]